MNESRKIYDASRLEKALTTKKAPATGTADALSDANESASIIAPSATEAGPFAYVADPDFRMPRTFEESAEHFRKTGKPNHLPIELGRKLAKDAMHAIIDREMTEAINSCAEEDLLILVDAIRLNRDLHGEDSCQTGNLIGAILQTLGFGAGYVSRTEDGDLEVYG